MSTNHLRVVPADIETEPESVQRVRAEVEAWTDFLPKLPADITYSIDDQRRIIAAGNAVIEEARAMSEQTGRLRHALRKAMDRELSRTVVDEINRRDGDMPSREWVSLRRDTIESNAYANDGLQFGDLDGVTGDSDSNF